MRKKLALLILALAAVAASLIPVPKAEAACKKICCPDGSCVTCCSSPCPTIVCPP